MRRVEAGRVTGLGVVTLIDFTFLTVAVTFLGVASALAVRVVEVLRDLLLRGVVGVEADDLTGIGIDSDVYSIIIHEKRTPWGSCVPVCQVVLSLT